RSIEREIDHRRSIEEDKGKKRKRTKKKEGKKEYLARAPSSPACRRRPQVACRFFSRVRRRSVSLRGETDRGDRIVRRDSWTVPPSAVGRDVSPLWRVRDTTTSAVGSAI
ncbi:hypothetical protein GW17_00060107, partial [Ensete ventricosum]